MFFLGFFWETTSRAKSTVRKIGPENSSGPMFGYEREKYLCTDAVLFLPSLELLDRNGLVQSILISPQQE